MAVRCRIGLHDEDKSEGTFMGTKMRIAQIAPLTEAVPPKLYGGTERVVSWLTEALVEQGRDVTLFASCGRASKSLLHGKRVGEPA
jgi:hypothetical protein